MFKKLETEGNFSKWIKIRFPGASDGKESACNAGDPSLISGSEKSPGEENGNPLQYSCLKNSMDRGAWWVTVHRVAKSQTQLIDFSFTFHGKYIINILHKDKKTNAFPLRSGMW